MPDPGGWREVRDGGLKHQQATFDDTSTAYYDAVNNPQNSVIVAGEGVRATVTSVDADRNMVVELSY